MYSVIMLSWTINEILCFVCTFVLMRNVVQLVNRSRHYYLCILQGPFGSPDLRGSFDAWKARIKKEIVLCKRACGGPESQLVQFIYVISHCKNKPCFHISLDDRAAGDGKKSGPCSLRGGGVN
jgi:hypothetical protein